MRGLLLFFRFHFPDGRVCALLLFLAKFEYRLHHGELFPAGGPQLSFVAGQASKPPALSKRRGRTIAGKILLALAARRLRRRGLGFTGCRDGNAGRKKNQDTDGHKISRHWDTRVAHEHIAPLSATAKLPCRMLDSKF